nr:unnamed protein product [Callosobruchus analis]
MLSMYSGAFCYT